MCTLFNAKNDLKFTWDYSCKTEGELVDKNQEKFCEWQESADGMLIELTRKTFTEGEVMKIIKKYDADTNLVLKKLIWVV